MVRKNFYAILALFIGFFICLATSKNWRLFDDDYGAFYTGCIDRPGDVIAYFSGTKGNDQTIVPDGLGKGRMSDGPGQTYRPLTLVFYQVICKLFCDKKNTPKNATGLFWLLMLMHFSACVMIFFIFSKIHGSELAIFGAIGFCFFPGFGQFFGRLSIGPYFFLSILGSCVYLASEGFFLTKKLSYLFLASFLCFVAMLFHELALSWPLVLFGFLFIASPRRELFSAKTFKILSICLLPLLLYLGIKLGLFFKPYKISSFVLPQKTDYFQLLKTIVQKYLWRTSGRFYDILSFAVDGSGGWAMPRLFKILTLSVQGFLTIVFLRARPTGFFRLAGFLLLVWPSLFLTHQTRYLYVGLPVLLSANLEAISILKQAGKLIISRAIFLFYVGAWIFYGLFINATCLQALSKKYQLCANLLESICKTPALEKEDIFLVGLAQEIIPQSGVCQALKLFGFCGRVYCPKICCAQYSKLNSPFDRPPKKNLLEIKAFKRSLVLKSKNPKECWILIRNSSGELLLNRGYDGIRVLKIGWINKFLAKKVHLGICTSKKIPKVVYFDEFSMEARPKVISF